MRRVHAGGIVVHRGCVHVAMNTADYSIKASNQTQVASAMP
jgi:hypothetical protein